MAGNITVDVGIYGDHIGSAFAACAAADSGATVALVSPNRHWGTPYSDGSLGNTDLGDPSDAKRALGYLQDEFFNRNTREMGWKSVFYRTCPSVAELVTLDMLKARPNILLLDDKEIASIAADVLTCVGGDTITATVWGDGDEDGDLVAAYGVPMKTGREAAATYGESRSGYRPGTVRNVDMSDGMGGFVYGVIADPGTSVGAADNAIQTFSYRMCLTNVEGNQKDWPTIGSAYDDLIEFWVRTEDYTASDYLPFVQQLTGGTMRGKIDVNRDLLPDPDLATWPTMTRAQRQVVGLRQYRSQYRWFEWLLNDPSVHPNCKRVLREWKPCKDENLASSSKFINTPTGVPGNPYRRGIRWLANPGYMMTEADFLAGGNTKSNSIGLHIYDFDSHVCQYIGVPGGYRRDPEFNQLDAVLSEIPFDACYDPNFPNILSWNCMGASWFANATLRIDIWKAGRGAFCGIALAEMARTGTDALTVNYADCKAIAEARGHVVNIP